MREQLSTRRVITAFVIQEGDEWLVINEHGYPVHSARTNAEAWRWLDRHLEERFHA